MMMMMMIMKDNEAEVGHSQSPIDVNGSVSGCHPDVNLMTAGIGSTTTGTRNRREREITNNNWMEGKAFRSDAPSAWNTLQSELKMSQLISLEAFHSILKDQQWECFQPVFLNNYWLVTEVITPALYLCTPILMFIQWLLDLCCTFLARSPLWKRSWSEWVFDK